MYVCVYGLYVYTDSVCVRVCICVVCMNGGVSLDMRGGSKGEELSGVLHNAL